MGLKEELKQFSKWSGIVAIFTIIFGALSALSGVFAFIVGAIPGVIMIIVGVKLLNAKRQADEIVTADGVENEGKMQVLINNLTTYFKLQGILYIVSIVFSIIGIIVMVFVGAQFYTQF